MCIYSLCICVPILIYFGRFVFTKYAFSARMSREARSKFATHVVSIRYGQGCCTRVLVLGTRMRPRHSCMGAQRAEDDTDRYIGEPCTLYAYGQDDRAGHAGMIGQAQDFYGQGDCILESAGTAVPVGGLIATATIASRHRNLSCADEYHLGVSASVREGGECDPKHVPGAARLLSTGSEGH